MKKAIAAILCGMLVLINLVGCSDGSLQTNLNNQIKEYIEYNDNYIFVDALDICLLLNQYLSDDMKFIEDFEYSAKTSGLYTYKGKAKLNIYTNPNTLEETSRIRFEYIYSDDKLSEEALPVIKRMFDASIEAFNLSSAEDKAEIWQGLVPLDDVLVGNDYNVIVKNHIRYIIADDYATDADGKNILDENGNKTSKALLLIIEPTSEDDGVKACEQDIFYRAWLKPGHTPEKLY